MNTKLKNKLTMWMVLRTFLEKNASTTDALPGFASLFILLHGTIEQVTVINNALGEVINKSSENKRQLKDLLILKTTEIAGMIRAFAVLAEDMGLSRQMKLPKSTLLMLTDVDLIIKAQAVYDKGCDKENDYTGYGITKEKLDDLKSCILRYKLMIPQPRIGIEDHKHSREELQSEMDAGDATVLKMDALVEIIHYSNELFYSDYWNRRKIINVGHRKLSLELRVLDDASGSELAKAKVSIKLKSGTDQQKIVKFTGKKGGIKGKNMEAGEYLYEVTFGDYISETGSFFINEGLLTKVIVRMRKA